MRSPPPPAPRRSAAREPGHPVRGESRWPAVAAVLAVGTLHMALPDAMNVGPPWLLLAVVGVLLVPTVVAHRTGRHDLNAWLGNTVQALITLALIWSIVRLLVGLSAHTQPPLALLRAAGALWVTNVLVFASWYWRLDAGGPNARDRRRHEGAAHARGAFLFPQMAMDDGGQGHGAGHGPAWRPEFVDYVFLAFCTSTAFSPTDTPVLSRWAKLLTMVQATISFVAVAVLAARAVNIL